MTLEAIGAALLLVDHLEGEQLGTLLHFFIRIGKLQQDISCGVILDELISCDREDLLHDTSRIVIIIDLGLLPILDRNGCLDAGEGTSRLRRRLISCKCTYSDIQIEGDADTRTIVRTILLDSPSRLILGTGAEEQKSTEERGDRE